MAISSGNPIKATEVSKELNHKPNCFQYNISSQSTTTITLPATTLIVFFHTFSDCAVALIRNEFDFSSPRSFVHTIKSGTNLNISASNGQLSIINNSNVGGTALVLAY